MLPKSLSPKQADRLIKSGDIVTLWNHRWNEVWTGVIVSRDRWCINTADGCRFERNEMYLSKD